MEKDTKLYFMIVSCKSDQNRVEILGPPCTLEFGKKLIEFYEHESGLWLDGLQGGDDETVNPLPTRVTEIWEDGFIFAMDTKTNEMAYAWDYYWCPRNLWLSEGSNLNPIKMIKQIFGKI